MHDKIQENIVTIQSIIYKTRFTEEDTRQYPVTIIQYNTGQDPVNKTAQDRVMKKKTTLIHENVNDLMS